MGKLLCVAWLAALVGCSDDAEPLQISTDTGVVKGLVQGESRMWRGVPYAAPPVGELRWKKPKPAAAWDDVRETFELGAACPQVFSAFGAASGEEDCLYLNIWASRDKHDAPVLVWFHGGAFAFGSGGETYYNGQHLAETQGVVIVAVNYRLGAFGFLAHAGLAAEDAGYPTSGNYGLEDQLAALQWVQRNIKAFGGDPTHVTVFGESAGGISTCWQYTSSKTAGLFHAAIAESGLCSNNLFFPTRAEAEATGARVATSLGCTGNDAAVATCMRGKTVAQLLTAVQGPKISDQQPGGPFLQPDGLLLAPNVDGLVVEKNSRDAFASGSFMPRPLLLGSNRDEGTLFQSSLVAKETTSESDMRNALATRFTSEQVDAILAHYPPASFPSIDRAIAEITGDGFFVCPTRRAARGAAAAGASVYRYSFEREVENPVLPGLGVFHASEIPFVFGEDSFPFGVVGAGGQPVADKMQTAWTTFAATGNPGADWPKFETASDQLLVLDVTSNVRTGHKAALCDFWDTLP
ncbi:MAG TPA: carboxylesterase family protein [Kofleriaceae bacterium]|nr:carboxylesterase family protein [Kofleriaceae bacterium]